MRRFFQKILWNLILNIVALAAVMYLLSDVLFAQDIVTIQQQARALLLAGTIIGFLNVTIKPLMTLLALPMVLITIGLFLLVINAFIFYVTVQIMPGHEIVVLDVSAYFWGALLFSVVNTLEHVLFPYRPKKD